MKPSEMTTVELLRAIARECEFAADLPHRDLETAAEYRAKSDALAARAKRLETEMRAHGVVAMLGSEPDRLASESLARINAPDATPGDTTPQGSSER